MPAVPSLESKNIFMLLQSDYPPDIRLTKEIKALTQAGFVVHLLCNNKKQGTHQEIVDSATVHRLPAYTNLPTALGKLIRLPLFFSPLWFYYAAGIIKKYGIDFIHVHDLPLAPLAVVLGKIFHRPVIYDMHENYPAAMEEWQKKDGFWQGVLKNPKLAHAFNNFSLKRAHKIIVVVEEQRQNLIDAGVAPTKIHVVGNTVDVDSFMALPVDQDIIEQYNQHYVILYIGSFSTERGLETVIKAMPSIKESIPHAKFLLVGDGKNARDLKALSASLGLQEQVEFVGWVDFSKVPSFMHAADIHIIPQPSNPANDTTLPHKLFQYMLVGKPILTSDARPLKRIVQETKCGLSFKSHDEIDFAGAVRKIAESDIDYKQNGKNAVFSKYNWQTTCQELILLYSQLMERKDIS